MTILEELKHSYIWRKYKESEEMKKWKRDGCPIPPTHVYKSYTCIEYGKRYNIKSFIETGTYHGAMIKEVYPYFNEIYSVEIVRNLYEENVQKYKGCKKVHLYLGDCLEKLPEMISDAKTNNLLFWLDGHYSGGITGKGKKEDPIYESLEIVFASMEGKRGYVILIDDARTFVDSRGINLNEIMDYIRENNPISLEVKYDIIRAVF